MSIEQHIVEVEEGEQGEMTQRGIEWKGTSLQRPVSQRLAYKSMCKGLS